MKTYACKAIVLIKSSNQLHTVHNSQAAAAATADSFVETNKSYPELQDHNHELDSDGLATGNCDVLDPSPNENQEPTDVDKSDLFSLDENEPVPPLWPHITLQDLRTTQETIEQIRDYSFQHEQAQWTEDEFDSFCSLSHEPWTLDDPDFHLSLKTYLTLSVHSSQATYEAIWSCILERYPDSTMLSFDQV